MPVYLGLDLPVWAQTVCSCDTADGEIHRRPLDHQQDDVRAFYRQLAAPAIIGVGSSGYALWLHQLVEELGHHVRVGDGYAIRQFARRRQKNDRRDAELLLGLLPRGNFPAIRVDRQRASAGDKPRTGCKTGYKALMLP
jgi:transposase